MFASRFPYRDTANSLTKVLAEKQENGIKVIDLTESNPTRAGFRYDEKLVLTSLSQPGVMAYNPSPQGVLDARQAVAGYYRNHGHEIDPSDVFLCASTSEAYAYLFKLLADPGDEVLIPRPGYPLFELLAGLESVHTVEYPLKYENTWYIDAETLNNSISNRTKAIVVVSPNNPTGSYLKSAELKALNRICTDHNCALIVDEVFLDYRNRSHHQKVLSSCVNNDALTFTLSGFSKILALPQLKMSWIVISGPQRLCDEAKARLEFIADTYLSVSSTIQTAADSLFGLQESIQSQIIGRVEENGKMLDALFDDGHHLDLLYREGGWYAVARIKKEIQDEQLTNQLLEFDDVYVHPGYFYNFAGNDHIVISLLPEQHLFQTGINRLDARLKKI